MNWYRKLNTWVSLHSKGFPIDKAAHFILAAIWAVGVMTVLKLPVWALFAVAIMVPTAVGFAKEMADLHFDYQDWIAAIVGAVAGAILGRVI